MREIYIDNAKALAIILVVLGHISLALTENTRDIFGVVAYYIYCFHMPFFFMLSGLSYRASQQKRGGG